MVPLWVVQMVEKLADRRGKQKDFLWDVRTVEMSVAV